MIPDKFKPMKPDDVDLAKLDKLQFPLYIQPKYDGIRCLIFGGKAWTSTLKLVPNEFIQRWASHFAEELEGCDGELLIGPHDKGVFQRTTSGVMSRGGEPNFRFVIFDIYDPANPGIIFEQRYSRLQFKNFNNYRSEIAPAQVVYTESDLLPTENMYLEEGYEGIILRAPKAAYKFGRSTFLQGIILRLKRFVDSEGVVIGYKEKLHNANPAKINALGRAERSSHKEGLVPTGTLGAFLCRDAKGQIFDVGGGLTDAQREEFWINRDSYIGKLVKFKYFPVGVKDAPRFPTFLGFRHILDIESDQAYKLLTETKS